MKDRQYIALEKWNYKKSGMELRSQGVMVFLQENLFIV